MSDLADYLKGEVAYHGAPAEWEKVLSSAVSHVREAGPDLDVRWVNGREFRYKGAGKWYYKIAAGDVESIGHLMNDVIKPNYPGVPL